MIHSFTVTFRAKYLTGMVTSVPPYETFSLIKKKIFRQSKIYKNHFENLNFWGMWPLGHAGHVTYSFINMLFISTGIFDDKLRPQNLTVYTSPNSPLTNVFQYLWRKPWQGEVFKINIYSVWLPLLKFFKLRTRNFPLDNIFWRNIRFISVSMSNYFMRAAILLWIFS